ncbi:hypothetical protein AAFC00_001156 [Neodothiora populina]|uniref:Frequency clock protein n=1 Tax=Neodothiora populina TaxID=2781224 RepID=A0ABR3PNZ6_9PEZI
MDSSPDKHLRPVHPRRPPAHMSVSLLHSPRVGKPASPLQQTWNHDADPCDTAPDGMKDRSDQSSDNSISASNDKSSSQSRPLVSKDDSGESSNADKWFDNSNNDAAAHNADLDDNDPPFFLQHSSSEEKTSPQHPGMGVAKLNAQNLHHAHAMMGGDGSSTDEFRSVIDDLTIQNRKLKRRLKKYETLQDAHLNKDKLFEVRVHGLSAHKKKQLEDMLRKFTVEMSNEQTRATGVIGGPSSTSTGTTLGNSVPGLVPHVSSKASNFNDSAYASASASGHGSSAQSASASGRKNPFQTTALARHHNIHSYLDEIPQNLLPRHTANMSEKAKQKLVVRRLEQIFSGKGAESTGHQHPMQQQEVSQSAAKAERNAREGTGQQASAEGSREARIMDTDPEDPEEQTSNPALVTGSPRRATSESRKNINGKRQSPDPDNADEGSPNLEATVEQRPTRPLDLDPQRAQFPSENIEYIRHLGFSPPDAYSDRSPEEGHGWIYLNLLMNMAQLHTINVTIDFVKDALQQYSTRFELSSDGRKVRWRRDWGIVRTSSEYSASSFPTSMSGQKPRKRVKISHAATEADDNQQEPLNKLSYTPLFFRRTSEESSFESSDDEDYVDSDSGPQLGESSAPQLTPGGTHINNVSPRKGRKRQSGPMIFYSNAKFCTDLSGDRKTEELMHYNPIMYHVATSQPVGDNRPPTRESVLSEKKGPLDNAISLPEAMDLADNPIPPSLELDFPAQSPLTSGTERSPFDLEASGIGGVSPADNFAINVQTKHAATDHLAPETNRTFAPGKYPDRIEKILEHDEGCHSGRTAVHKEVLSMRQRELPPSRLPPASCYIDFDESDESDDEYDDSPVSVAQDGRAGTAPQAVPQPMQLAPWSSNGTDVESDGDNDYDEDAESDASVDFLATARELDPESVRLREREYDATMADRWAEEIPAGSSAATAGGGSGFASPASDYNSDENDSDDEARPRRSRRNARFPRAGTEDSMLVNGESL